MQRKEVLKRSEECQKLLTEISEKTASAREMEGEAIEKKKSLDIKQAEIAVKKVRLPLRLLTEAQVFTLGMIGRSRYRAGRCVTRSRRGEESRPRDHEQPSRGNSVSAAGVRRTVALRLRCRGFKQPAVSVATVCRSVLAILRPQSADTWAECQAMMAGKAR